MVVADGHWQGRDYKDEMKIYTIQVYLEREREERNREVVRNREKKRRRKRGKEEEGEEEWLQTGASPRSASWLVLE